MPDTGTVRMSGENPIEMSVDPDEENAELTAAAVAIEAPRDPEISTRPEATSIGFPEESTIASPSEVTRPVSVSIVRIRPTEHATAEAPEEVACASTDDAVDTASDAAPEEVSVAGDAASATAEAEVDPE